MALRLLVRECRPTDSGTLDTGLHKQWINVAAAGGGAVDAAIAAPERYPEMLPRGFPMKTGSTMDGCDVVGLVSSAWSRSIRVNSGCPKMRNATNRMKGGIIAE